MYGTLAGALSGRKVPFDRSSFTATVDGRIVGAGKTIRIKSIRVHYQLTIPADSREAAVRALALHPRGCPAHESVRDAIAVSWDAALRAGSETVTVSSESLPHE